MKFWLGLEIKIVWIFFFLFRIGKWLIVKEFFLNKIGKGLILCIVFFVIGILECFIKFKIFWVVLIVGLI